MPRRNPPKTRLLDRLSAELGATDDNPDAPSLLGQPLIPPDMDIETFFKTYIKTEKGKPYDFEGRQYLHEIFADQSRVIFEIKGRQVGSSTKLVGYIIYLAARHPQCQILFMSDTMDKAAYFSKHRFRPILRQTKLVPPMTIKQQQVGEYTFPNGSSVFFRSAYDEFDQSRSISADYLLIDEFQDTPVDSLAVAEQTMFTAPHARIWLAGTGSYVDTPFDRFWKNTTMAEWVEGKGWVKQNTTAEVSGYHISQAMMPWVDDAYIEQKRKDYPPDKFDTEVMGVNTTGAALPLSPAVVRTCYVPGPMQDRIASDWRPHTYAALDLASGGPTARTVLTISRYDPNTGHKHVLFTEKYDDARGDDLFRKIHPRLEQFRPDHVGSDAGGNDRLVDLMSTEYDMDVHWFRFGDLKDEVIKYPAPEYSGREANSNSIVIKRTAFMQRVMSRFHEAQITIPDTDATQWCVEHLTAESLEYYKTPGGDRRPRYALMPGRADDFLMTLVYTEAMIHMYKDENNPRNRREFVGVAQV